MILITNIFHFFFKNNSTNNHHDPWTGLATLISILDNVDTSRELLSITENEGKFFFLFLFCNQTRKLKTKQFICINKL